MKEELIKKIISKKEFSDLAERDIEIAFKRFDKKDLLDEEKIKSTRDLLRRVFSMFGSRKLLNLKDKNSDWILKKHISTKERALFYKKIYKRIFSNFNLKRNFDVIDLGAGVNGVSYSYFKKVGYNVNYIAIESIGQFVRLMNSYFEKNSFNAKAFQLSLFELKKIIKLIENQKKPKIVFLFKVIDSLEMMQKNYSKKFLVKIVPLCDFVIVSFATRSLLKKKKFFVNRKWFLEFVRENFFIIDDFEIGGERYFILKSAR